MGKYELWVDFGVVQDSSESGGGDTHTCTQTDRHINTVTWPCLGVKERDPGNILQVWAEYNDLLGSMNFQALK